MTDSNDGIKSANTQEKLSSEIEDLDTDTSLLCTIEASRVNDDGLSEDEEAK